MVKLCFQCEWTGWLCVVQQEAVFFIKKQQQKNTLALGLTSHPFYFLENCSDEVESHELSLTTLSVTLKSP